MGTRGGNEIVCVVVITMRVGCGIYTRQPHFDDTCVVTAYLRKALNITQAPTHPTQTYATIHANKFR